MIILKPTTKDLRFARDEFRRLLKAKAKEPSWQRLFTQHPYVLSKALPLRVSPHEIIPLGRPGRSEADFVFYPKGRAPMLTYGVVELKRPDTGILTMPRRNTFTLSRDAATALAQAKGYARQLTRQLMMTHSANLFLGNSAHIFLILGLSEDLSRVLTTSIQQDLLQDLLPDACRLIPYDTLLAMFEENVPPLIITLLPVVDAEPLAEPLEAERGAHDRRSSDLARRMRAGSWRSYAAATGISKFQEIELVKHDSRRLMLRALESEARRYHYKTTAGVECEPNEALRAAIEKVAASYGDRHVPSIYVIEDIARELMASFRVESRDRRSLQRTGSAPSTPLAR